MTARNPQIVTNIFIDMSATTYLEIRNLIFLDCQLSSLTIEHMGISPLTDLYSSAVYAKGPGLPDPRMGGRCATANPPEVISF